MKTIFCLFIVLSLNLSGCATTHISRQDADSNQSSLIKFSEFDYVVIKPLTIPNEIADDYDNKAATKMLNDKLYEQLLGVFYTLTPYAEFDQLQTKSTLIIEPSIVKMKSVGAVARIFTGVLAGGSALVLKTTYINAETQQIIANPSFYQHANAWAAAYKAGSDKRVIHRIAKLAADYATNNY